ncbi:MAG: LD-carboxypeptidase [Thermoanaerobacteraceae bacterium]|nr:LD-carboxypeptidase [Thermoanaerobacteraceae bacterium]
MNIKPKRLKKGSRIGVVAPAGPAKEDVIKRGIEFFKSLGFEVVVGESAMAEPMGYLAAHDELRAWDIDRMFEDKTIDGIIAVRGGYGSTRILSMIDYDKIEENPKPFIGYSDITALLTAIYNMTGLVTFHGPNLTSAISDYTLRYFKTQLMDGEPAGVIEIPEGIEVRCIRPGQAEGRLVGGNLSLICSMLGTPYEIDTFNRILFLEDVNEEPYRVDRMLTQLKNSGKLEKTCGILLGSFKGCGDVQPVFEDILGSLEIPVLSIPVFGHDTYKLTIPEGVMAEIDAEQSIFNIKESPVI